MSILAGIVALLKAIPAIRDIFEKMVALSLEHDRKKNEAEAAARKVAKDAAVDHALDGMPVDSPAARQFIAAHEPARLAPGEGGGTGVGAGRTENH